MKSIGSLGARWRVPPALARLQKSGLGRAVIGAVGNYIVAAADRELYQINPRYPADRLVLDERSMLHLVVAGAAEGVFSLNWQTSGSVCKYDGRTAQSLAGLVGLHVCENCDQRYEVSRDDEAPAIVSVKESVMRDRRAAPVQAGGRL